MSTFQRILTGSLLLCAALLGPAVPRAGADETREPTARDIVVEAVNPMPTFQVRITVDKKDRVYKEGEEVVATVRSEKEGYLYLLHCSSTGKVSVVFPNKYQADNKIPADTPVTVPDPKAEFRFRVKEPFGTEVLKAVVFTEQPKELDAKKLAGANATALDKDQVTQFVRKDLEVVPVDKVRQTPGGQVIPDEPRQGGQKVKQKHKEWAEHQVEFTTVGDKEKPKQKPRLDPEKPPRQGPAQQRKVGVFIGIAKYKPSEKNKIRDLNCADVDAKRMAQAMIDNGGLAKEDVLVLTNEQATLKNIEQAIRVQLPQATQPGDTVVIYWSGHGGRISNKDGTEPDGFDEYLVPHDGELGSTDAVRATMLMDKTFGRWVQELDGRRLVVILDACHSGGQAAGASKDVDKFEKGLDDNAGLPGGKGLEPFKRASYKGLGADEETATKENDFYTKKGADYFFVRAFRSFSKDIGQKNAAVLASCKASEISFERRERDMSVMTYFLVKYLGDGGNTLTLQDAVTRLTKDVGEYINKNFEGASQTPILVDRTEPKVDLKK